MRDSQTIRRAARALTAAGCGMLALLASACPLFAASSYPSQQAWIEHANEFLQTAGWNNLDAFMWLHENKTAVEGYDWRIQQGGASQAYHNGIGGLAPGVYVDGFPQRPYPNPGPYVPDTAAIAQFENQVQQHQARVGWFESLMTPFPTADVQAVHARGSTPYIVLEPYDVAQGDTAYTGPSRLGAIIAGNYDLIPGSTDQGLQRWAQAAAALKDPSDPGKRIEISFGHEMNGNWFTWGIDNGHNGNTAQSYINAFRHVVDIFNAAGADNVDFVWTINASWHDDFSMAFPGAEYVDRMGMNGYNRGDFPPGTHPTSHPDFYRDWREFEEIFGQWDPFNPDGVHNYNKLVEIAAQAGKPNMPIMVGEFASTPEPATLCLLTLGSLMLMWRRRC